MMGEARIINGLRNGDRLRIAIDRQQAPLFAQLREDQARVAAATKCAIQYRYHPDEYSAH
ncbi:Uncharacterised protein [Salmonella enterica subsp. enterica]|nr:Uncharacterised protein [Salmonella enterica subsp. enterica]